MRTIASMNRAVLFLSFFLLIPGLAACEYINKETMPSSSESTGKPEITIGSKSHTEQRLLMKITSLLLSEHGFSVNEISFRGSLSIRSALEEGVIDQYWEYPNTARIYYHHQLPIYDSDAAFQTVSKEDQTKNIIWLPGIDLNSTWVLLIKKELAKQYSIKTISDFARYAQDHKIKMATNEEFLVREDGLGNLEQAYHFSIDRNNVITVESLLLPRAVNESRVDVAVGIVSDSHIKAYNLTVLEDDQHVFPPYHPAPVIRGKKLKDYPQIAEILNQLTEKIDDKEIMDMIYQVEVLHKDLVEVAQDFLVETGLIQNDEIE
ncbi:osmoprotectant transport system substrate-binding protein [Bacillus fengqiuensis]|nr:osmoprotectant transport system substrate-binding protein [Bacillus fengqiuensis]